MRQQKIGIKNLRTSPKAAGTVPYMNHEEKNQSKETDFTNGIGNLQYENQEKCFKNTCLNIWKPPE
jgi:hypothetical protein